MQGTQGYFSRLWGAKRSEDVQIAPLPTHAAFNLPGQGRRDVLPGTGRDVPVPSPGSVSQRQNGAELMNESEPFLAVLVTFSVTQSHSVNLS